MIISAGPSELIDNPIQSEATCPEFNRRIFVLDIARRALCAELRLTGLGFSETPGREALDWLEREGLVELTVTFPQTTIIKGKVGA